MANNPVINLPEKYQREIQNNPELAARRQNFLPQVYAAAEKYGVPPGLLDMSLMQESRYTPGVSGDQGQSHGIAQIQTPTAKQYGIDAERVGTDPNYAIDSMAKIYSGIRDTIGEDQFSDWGKARVGYQSGPGAVGNRDSWGPVAKDNYRAGQSYQQLNDSDAQTAVRQALNLGGVAGASATGGGQSRQAGAPSSEPYSSALGGNVKTQQVKSPTSPNLPERTNGRQFRAKPYQDFYEQTFGRPWEYRG